MVRKDEFSLIKAELNENFKDQFLVVLSNINSVHIKQRDKPEIKEKLEEKDSIRESIKVLRKNLNNLLKRLNLNEYELLETKVDKDKRVEFVAKDLHELITHLLEEIDFFANRFTELNNYISQGIIELENLRTLKASYTYLEKLNFSKDKIIDLKQFNFRIFTTFSKNFTNLQNLLDFSEFPNFYEVFEIPDDRIGFYILYPKDKEEEFRGRIRLIHSEEVPILKKYLTNEGINFSRINKEIKFIENLVSRYRKEQNRITSDNLAKIVGINEIVQNIEEYNWVEQQFERSSSNRLILKFFVPISKKEEILQILFKTFKDNIIFESFDISKKQPMYETSISKTKKIEKKKKKGEIKEKYISVDEEIEEHDEKEDLREKTPTIMKNFFLVKPFETITRMYGTPNYSEIDPTPIIAITFPILFGLMFGDIGHAVILIIAGILGAILLRKRSKDVVNLCWIIFFCGWAAFFVGFLYGEFFGRHEIEIFGNVIWHLKPISIASIALLVIQFLGYIVIIGGILVIIGVLIIAIKRRLGKRFIGLGVCMALFSLIMYLLNLQGIFDLRIFNITLFNPLNNIMNVFTFAVYIGVFHINLGWFIQFLNYWKQHRKYLAFSDSFIKILLLTGGTVLIFDYGFDIYTWFADPYPILLVLIPGILLLISKPFGKLFKISYLQNESFGGLLGEGSIEAFDTALSIMSNVASYIRLLALALAHIALLYSINAMSTLIEGESIGVEIVNFIGAIFGNLVVILLEGLLVFINALRLHFYEFFFKFYRGAGIDYFPFYLDNDYSIINFRGEIDRDIIIEEIEKEIDTKSVKEEINKAKKYILEKFQ